MKSTTWKTTGLFWMSLLLFGTSEVMADDVLLCEAKIQYSLEGEGYQTQKVFNRGFEILVVKFPPIPSTLLRTKVIPNFAIAAERVPPTTTTIDYLNFKLGQIQSQPGFNTKPSHDDILSCALGESINLYYEYWDGGGALHSVYVVVKVQNGVGFSITFDCTADLYPSQRPTLQRLLQSLRIQDSPAEPPHES